MNVELYILGMVLMAAGGGCLHDVPFPRFLAAITLLTIGSKLMGAAL